MGSAETWPGWDAALVFPFSASLFSCGCLASESAPASVVMVNQAEVEERGGQREKLDESAGWL